MYYIWLKELGGKLSVEIRLNLLLKSAVKFKIVETSVRPKFATEVAARATLQGSSEFLTDIH